MAAAQPEPAKSDPAGRTTTYTYTNESDTAVGGGGPPTEPPTSPPSQGEAIVALSSAAPSWLSWELTKAAQEARASRTRVFAGLALLAFTGLAVLVAGLYVREETFWVAVSPAFAAAAMALIAFGANRLGVFAQTAELLGRRSEAPRQGTAELTESERMAAETKRRAQAYYEVGMELGSLTERPKGSPSRENLLGAHLALQKAAVDEHAEGTRQLALLTLALDEQSSKDSEEQAFRLLLRACAYGSDLAAYNLGALYARRVAEVQSDRNLLITFARQGVAPAAFMVGVLDASTEAVHAQELPDELFTWPL